MASQPPPAPPGQCRRDASICRCVAPLSVGWGDQRCHVVSSTPTTTLPPCINYGSSPLSLRPSELSLPEVFSAHRTLAAPAPPPLHVFKLKIIIISAASLPCCLSASELSHPSEYSALKNLFENQSPRHLPAFSDTARRFNSRLPRPLCLLRLPLPSDALRLPIDIHHDFPRHFPSSPLHRRRHKSAIEAAYDQQTPTSRRHRPPRNSVRRHATALARSRNTPRSPTRTRSTRHRPYPLSTPLLRRPTPPTIPVHYPARRSTSAPPPHSPARHAACPERVTAVVHRRRRPLRLPASPCLQYCRPMLHTPLPPSQRDAQRYSQRQRMPPSFAIASAVDLRRS
ncbi:hypothetical protein DFH09DRAFT_1310395 [Mycena vulgaris]|nr:hypothetical protein DFH09DRAFT_1310395 [Mycena vulgaris]